MQKKMRYVYDVYIKYIYHLYIQKSSKNINYW